MRLLHHPSETVNRRALARLRAAGERDALPEVKRLMEGASFAVRLEALPFVCQYDERPPDGQRRGLLTGATDDIQVAVATCLAVRHGDMQTLPEARRVLGNMLEGSRGVRGKLAALEALMVIQDLCLDNKLFALLEDRSPAVVIQAIQSAGSGRRPEFVPALARKLEDRRYSRCAAQVLVGGGRKKLRPGALELLDNVLVLDDRRRIIPLVDHILLKECSSQEDNSSEKVEQGREKVLLRLMQVQDTWLRAAAFYTVGQRGISSLRKYVEAARSEGDTLVREAADLALRKLGHAAVPEQRLARIEKAIFLRGIEIFSQTTTQELARVVEIAHPIHFPQRTPLFKEGETADRIYMVVSGRVGIHQNGWFAETLGPGESIGVWEVFDDLQRRATSAVAIEDTTILQIARTDLFNLIDAHPEIARGILKGMAGRIRWLSELGP